MGHFFYFLTQFFSGSFDTSRSMIPHLVPDISPCDAFCDRRTEQQEQEELGILGVRYSFVFFSKHFLKRLLIG